MEYPNPIPHPEYPQYLISRDGQCYSKITNKWLKPCLNSQGRDRFWIYGKRHFAHRLVAQTYIPNYNELPCIILVKQYGFRVLGLIIKDTFLIHSLLFLCTCLFKQFFCCVIHLKFSTLLFFLFLSM